MAGSLGAKRNQRALEVGAVDDEVGRAPARDGVREIERRDEAIVAPAQDADRPRRRGERRQRVERAERRQHPRRVGRELQPGAELFQRRGAFEDDHL